MLSFPGGIVAAVWARLCLAGLIAAYRLDKVGVLDLIDAQRILFATQRQQLETWVAWHLWQAAVERLLGALPEVSAPSEPEENS